MLLFWKKKLKYNIIFLSLLLQLQIVQLQINLEWINCAISFHTIIQIRSVTLIVLHDYCPNIFIAQTNEIFSELIWNLNYKLFAHSNKMLHFFTLAYHWRKNICFYIHQLISTHIAISILKILINIYNTYDANIQPKNYYTYSNKISRKFTNKSNEHTLNFYKLNIKKIFNNDTKIIFQLAGYSTTTFQQVPDN